MQLEDIKPAHCFAHATRVLGEIDRIRKEMGRAEDGRPAPEIVGAAPREVYFEALAFWHRTERLAAEVGARPARATPPPAPALTDVRPGHVLRVIEAAEGRLADVRELLGIAEATPLPAIDAARQPTDVLVTLIRANRELSRVLERPFAPDDVFRQVTLASRYVAAAGGTAAAAPRERGRRPADCYARLQACLDRLDDLIEAAGHTALRARGAPADVVPGDVYDLASVVVGEAAFLHAITPGAAPVHAFEPAPLGHRLPADVDQLARTLEAQLAAIGRR